MSLHVIALSLASPARSGLPLRGSPPGRESGAHAALSCSPARRRRKLIGFLRRERRFDVVSYIVPLATMYIVPLSTISSLGYDELAPYFIVNVYFVTTSICAISIESIVPLSFDNGKLILGF